MPDSLPSTYLLRVSPLAWEDLGIERPDPDEDLDTLGGRHPMLAKFYDAYDSPEQIDMGRPIGELENPKVFRIRAGDERAAVWYDADGGVVWLCRVVSIPKFSSEDRAYQHLAGLESRGQLLPPEAEIEAMRAEQLLASAIDALIEARDAAFGQPDTWVEATLVRPKGERVPVGRCYVEREELGGGEFVTRYIVVVDLRRTAEALEKPVQAPDDWLVAVVDECFPEGEDVERAYKGLPRGARLREGEIPLVQESVVD